MALTRADRRLVLVTAGALIAAGVFFASVLVFATGGNAPTKRDAGPLYIGPETALVESLDLGSPLYFADPFGGNGFWLDREHGDFVALDVELPGNTNCSVRWRGRIDTYLDCHDNPVTKDQMDRYPVEIARKGEEKGSVFVNLKRRIPAPAGSTG